MVKPVKCYPGELDPGPASITLLFLNVILDS